MANNDPRFLSPMGERLAELGLEVKDVNVGRYIQIDLSTPRPEPEEFAEYGEFDTFVLLNPHDLPDGAKLWVYFNNKRPESRIPLHRLSRVETIADRFYLQHEDSWEGVTLEILIGGDLRALSVDPRDKGSIRVEGTSIDVTDRPDRELGKVNAEVTGELDITDRPTRELGSVSVPGVAKEVTLEAVRALLEILTGKDFATEAKLEAVRAILASLDGKDFATENTLSTLASKDFATEAKLEAVRALLEALVGKDFATENTLSTLASKDFATETTLEAVRVILASLESKDFATENTLSNIASTLANILAELQAQTMLLQAIKDNTTPSP